MTSPAPALPQSSLKGAATGRDVDVMASVSAPFFSAQHFVDTWIARPIRPAVTRDFSFKAVDGDPEW